jgi:N-methylhydantoinase A/oxoprolinase/acetone carboxylase beta subunit
MSLYRIGVDVGGTNMDAAILDVCAFDTPSCGVLASHKASTTKDITSGIESAIRAVLQDSQVDQSRVLSVTIGTTHFINALVEADARRLDRVSVVRLCGPFTRRIPPFSDFPSVCVAFSMAVPTILTVAWKLMAGRLRLWIQSRSDRPRET